MRKVIAGLYDVWMSILVIWGVYIAPEWAQMLISAIVMLSFRDDFKEFIGAK